MKKLKQTINKLYFGEKLKFEKLLNTIKIDELKNFEKLVSFSVNAIQKKKKIVFYGNGGSAADSQHLSTELSVRFRKNRHPFNSVALTTDVSKITAISNDFNFELIFSKQIESICSKGDICIALTTSGNSKNLFKAAKVANLIGAETFCISGNKGGALKKYTKYPIIIPSKDVSLIQVYQLFIGQIYCQLLEDYFY